MSSIARLENNRGDCGDCLLCGYDEREEELFCKLDKETLEHDTRSDCPLKTILLWEDSVRPLSKEKYIKVIAEE
jgi:hypothetical protein